VLLVRSKIIITSILLTSLFGCQVLDQRAEKPARVNDLSLQSKTKQNRQVNLAISLLEEGNKSKARQLISEVLAANPKQKTAVILSQQLELSASKFFKTKRFTTYQVKPGDSLGKIAHKWLGNSLYFVSLAELNKIRKPALLQPGSKIRIPLTKVSQQLVKEKSRSFANLRLLDQYYTNKKFTKGLEKSNTLFIIKKHHDRLLKRQQQLLEGLAVTAVSISDTEKMLDKAKKLKVSARSTTQKNQFQKFINTHQKTLFLEQATLLFDDKSYIDSAKKLIQVKKLDRNIKKQTKIFRMEKLIVNKLHEQAIVYYRNHLLDKALNHWQLIMQLQPKNKLSQKYIKRTEKLLDKLNKY